MPSEIFQHHHDYKGLEENLITMGGHPDLVLTNVTLPGGRIADITLQEGRVIHARFCTPRHSCHRLLGHDGFTRRNRYACPYA